MPRTIEFNTGRKYTRDGQIIRATLHDDGVVTFYDQSRMIDGQFECEDAAHFTKALVLDMYDHGHYRSTTRSSRDGMYRGGCNSTNPTTGVL